MRRRDFIASALLSGAGAWPLRLSAQTPTPVVGVLSSGALDGYASQRQGRRPRGDLPPALLALADEVIE